MYGNWIKILGLNQVRKEKEKQRRQHLEDVRNQREAEKATTEDEEENRVPEEKSSTMELREEKLSGGRKEETQTSKVAKNKAFVISCVSARSHFFTTNKKRFE